MSFYTMTSGTYTNYYNLLEKLRDEFVAIGFTVDRFNENMISGVKKGHRLHVHLGNVYIAIAGGNNEKPDYVSGTDLWTTNSTSGIVVMMNSTDVSSNARWDAGDGVKITMECRNNNNFYMFKQGNNFILCNRFTSRKFGWLAFLRQTSYNSAKTYQVCAGSYMHIAGTAAPTYVAGYQGLPQFPWLGQTSSTTGARGGIIQDISGSTRFPIGSNHFSQGSVNASTTSGNAMFNFGTGYPSLSALSASSNIIQRTKTPFSEDFTPLPVEIYQGASGGFANSPAIKRLFLRDVHVIFMQDFEQEELYSVGTENFIILPFYEKSTTGLLTEAFCYGMGLCIKIGED